MIDSAGQKSEREAKKQKILLPYVLNHYLELYNQNPTDLSFKEDKHLNLMAYAIGRYESLHTPGDPVDPKLKESFQLIKHLMMPKIRERANKDRGAAFINNVVDKFDPIIANENLEWEEAKFPIYEARKDDRTYQFNLETGSIYAGGERVQLLPSFLKEQPNIVELYSSNLKEVWQVKGAPDLEEKVQEEGTDHFRVTAYSHEKFSDQRIVVRQKVDETGKNTDERPEITIERKALNSAGQEEWASYHRFDSQDKLAKGESIQESDLPQKVAAAIGARSCWVSRELDRIYVFDRDETEPYATVELVRQKKLEVSDALREADDVDRLEIVDDEEKNEGPLKISEFRFSDGGRLLSASDRDFIQYSSVEDEAFILPVGSNGIVSRLEYPRLELDSSGAKLSYTLTKSGAVSPSFPGWSLARLGTRPGNRHPADNVVPLPETFDHFQLLQKDGAQKVLIPARQFAQVHNSLGEPIPKCEALSPDGFQASTVFEFSVNPETNRLQAKRADAYAYLAYLSLTHKDYEGAKYYLDRANSGTGYSPRYREVFDWVQKWRDNSPNGQALKLHAAIFQDKIFDEYRIEQMRKGEKKSEFEEPAERMNRLEHLAGLYHNYRESLESREVGLRGSNPGLDLDPEEELRALKLTREFVNKNEDSIVHRSKVKAAEFKRAKAPDGSILIVEPNPGKFLGDDEDALLIWANAGSSSKIPDVTFGHQEWVLECFGHVFDQLITLDPESAEFKQLVQKIRFISGNPPPKDLSDTAKAAINQAQGYLLKVAELAKKSDLDELKQALEVSKGKFPKIRGSVSTRVERYETTRFEGLKELLSYKDPERAAEGIQDAIQAAEDKLAETLDAIDQDEEVAYFVKAAMRAMAKKEFQPQIDSLKKLSRFCEKFQTQADKIEQKNETLSPENKIPLPAFNKEYRQFIKNTLYGSGSPQTIKQIGNVLAPLKNVEVSGAEATMRDREAPEEAEEVEKTAQEVYGKFFTDPPEDLRDAVEAILQGEKDFRNRLDEQVNQIEKLEAFIDKTPTVADEQKIETSEMGKHAVLGDDKITGYSRYYRISSTEPEGISEEVFNRLASSGEKAVARLAEVHREDMRAYEKENRTIDITRGKAKKLRAHLVSQREELELQKNDYSRLLLQAVERFNTPAGILVMRRLTGRASKPNIDYLVNLWRRGDITKQPWDANPLKALGISEISESELAELDLWITSYMDATTALQHMDRVIHSADAYIESCGWRSSSSGDKQLAQALVQVVETKRNYNYFVPDKELTVPDLAMALRNPEIKRKLENRLAEKRSLLCEELKKIKDPVEHQAAIIDLFNHPDHNPVLSQILEEDKGLKNFIFSKGSDPDFRDLLFMEQREGIILRSAQVTTIRDMIHDPDAARQLIMGAGKSKVLSPLLALKKANGTNLVMLMLPEALYETNCRDLDATNRELFGQPIFRFEFNRHSDRSVEGLQETYIQLLQCVKNKGFVPTTKSSMLSFRNAYFELLNQLSEIPPEQIEIQEDKVKGLTDKIRIMSKILVLFGTRTDVLADEIDACLDVRKEVNFALGDPQRVNPIIHETGSELMEIILSADDGTGLAELKKALINNTSASIPPERLHALLEELGRSFYKENAPLADIPEDDFIEYLFDDNSLDGEMPEYMNQIKAQNPDLYKKVATAKAFLHRGYGSTLSRISNVNYGRDPQSKIWTIPYKASMAPSLGSEFDDTIERICFTLQDYVLNGVSYDQVYKVVADLHNTAIEELRSAEDEEINIDETEPGKQFKELVRKLDPEQVLGPNPSLAAFASEEKVTQLTNIINNTAKGKLTFSRRFVLPEMTQAPNRVNSVSDDAPAMVKHFSGFTGTPWNLHTYNDKIHAERSPGTDGRTWALLLQRDVKVKTFDYDPKKPIESLVDGASIVTGRYQATIDTGAYLRGQTNADYVTACLRKAEEEGLEGQSGVYFDESGKIVKKTGPKGKLLPIEVAAQGDLMECHTLYDQAHTVGADIKQGRKAKAVVTVGEATFIRDLFQAVWRLRQLHEEQDIEIVVSNEVKKLILGDKPDRGLKIDDILAFCLMNEARRESEDNLRAEKGKIQGKPNQVMLSGCAHEFSKAETSHEDIHAIAHGLGAAFTKRRPQDEIFDEYAQVRTSEDPATILEAARKLTKARTETMAEVLDEIRSKKDVDSAFSLAQDLRKTAEEIGDRKDPPSDWMPDEVDSSAMEAGQQVEVEAVAEVQVAQMVQMDAEVDAEVAVQAEKVVAAGKPVAAGAGGNISPVTAEHMFDLTFEPDLPPVLRNDYSSKIFLRQMSSTIGAFDPTIYVSGGVERQMLPSDYANEWNSPKSLNFGRVANTIFYTYRKAVNDVVIVKGPKGWRMFIPTIHEAQAGCRKFIRKANKEGFQAVQVNIGTPKPNIVFKTGNDRTDALPFTSEEDRKMFYRLYVQAKFFNGEIHYGSADERGALKTWLSEKGVKNCKQLFEAKILPTKPIKYNDDYPESPLYKVFEELGA